MHCFIQRKFVKPEEGTLSHRTRKKMNLQSKTANNQKDILRMETRKHSRNKAQILWKIHLGKH